MTRITNSEANAIVESKKSKRIFKIVLTGGPCAGKTSVVERFMRIAKAIPKLKVILCKEAATILKHSGIDFMTCGGGSVFQERIIDWQLNAEETAYIAAMKFMENHSDYTTIILCDRGIMDGEAYYNTPNDYEKVLNAKGLDKRMMYDRYDSVVCLRSAAIGAPQFYTTADGTPRDETIEEAAKLDKKCCAAWRDHQQYFEIDNTFEFYPKMDKAIATILKITGLEMPKKICRRYIVEMPDMFDIYGRCSDIEVCKDKTFFIRQDDPNTYTSIKIRKVGQNSTYYRTIQRWGMVKRPKDGKEVEQAVYDSTLEITEKEMVNSLGDVDGMMNALEKMTYSFHLGKFVYCELDVYPNNTKRAYLRTYLDSDTKDNDNTIRNFFQIVREVTYNRKYSEHEIARSAGKVLNR
ncbi:MAG: AAA family ATPase [Clostridia bacterium]|nr:AAA family ATPase [Clostridia bacterium]